MVVLLALPIVASVSFAYRLLQMAAPSNLLIARSCEAVPTLFRAGSLGALVLMLVAFAHTLTVAISSGAPGWLNLLVLVLLWDAIKLGLAGIAQAGRALIGVVRHH